MPQQKIIRNDSTLDRPEVRVTTEEVLELAKEFDKSFTTIEIAKIIFNSGKYRGISETRIERAVRASMAWMVRRGMAYVDGEIAYTTRPGCVSKPFLYAIHPDMTWNNKTKCAETNCGCADLLNRVFLFR